MRLNFGRQGHERLVYDGFNLADYFVIEGVETPLLPTFSAVTFSVPGAPGELFASRQVGTRSVKVRLAVDTETRCPVEGFFSMQNLSAPLNQRTPKPLYLGSDERYINAILVGETTTEQEAYWGIVTVEFVAYDPYFYGLIHEHQLKAGITEFSIAGNQSAIPEMNLMASGSQVKVTNMTTGEFVRFDSVAGATYHLSCSTPIVTVHGAYHPIDLESDSFVVSGTARIKLEGATGSLTYQERYL